MARHTTRDPGAPFLCNRCGSPKVVDYGSQVVCGNCGNVMQADTTTPERRRDPR